MSRPAFWIVALTALVAAAGSPPRVDAAVQVDPVRLEADYQRLVSGLMSPFCHGLTLENCPTRGAAEMRGQIREWLEAGRSPGEITDLLVEEWGESILGAPRFRGIGILAWTLPFVVLVAAGVTLALWLRRGGEGQEAAPGPGEISAATRLRLEREVRAALGERDRGRAAGRRP